MADMTLCKGDKCGIKSSCVRWDGNTSPCPYRQSYFINPPFKPKMDGTSCEHFIFYVGKQDA